MKRWSSAKFIIGAGGDWWPLPEEVEAISAIGGGDDVLKRRRFTESTDEEGQKRGRRRRRRLEISSSLVTEPTRGTVKKTLETNLFLF